MNEHWRNRNQCYTCKYHIENFCLGYCKLYEDTASNEYCNAYEANNDDEEEIT